MYIGRYRRRIIVFLCQILVTMIGVFVAFQFDRLREYGRLGSIADATQKNLIDELNLTYYELQESEKRLHRFGENLRRRLLAILAARRDDEVFRQPLVLQRDFASSTAIDIALGSAAAPDLDPNWTRRVSGVYEFIHLYNNASISAFETYIALAALELGRDMTYAYWDYFAVYGNVLKAIAWNRVLQDNIGPLLAHAKLVKIGRLRAAAAFREAGKFDTWETKPVVLSGRQQGYWRLSSADAYCVRVATRKGDDLDPVLSVFQVADENPWTKGNLLDQANKIREVGYGDDGGGHRDGGDGDAIWCGLADRKATYYLIVEEFQGRPGVLDVTVSPTFRDCDVCPEMEIQPGRDVALGRYKVTVDEYRAFATATGRGGNGCEDGGGESREDRGFSQAERVFAACVSAGDAAEYVSWLSRRTGAAYELPAEDGREGGAVGSEAGWGRTDGGGYGDGFRVVRLLESMDEEDDDGGEDEKSGATSEPR